MNKPQIVIDTCVLVSALRSSRGASYRLLEVIDSDKFDVNISVPLVLEYEEACTRHLEHLGLTAADLKVVLDYICRVSHHRAVSYLWRPLLDDPDDDMVLELAVAASCSHLVSFNRADFRQAIEFGIQVVGPKEFLMEIGELK